MCVLTRELRLLLTRELGIMMQGEEMRRLVDAFDTNEVNTRKQFSSACVAPFLSKACLPVGFAE